MDHRSNLVRRGFTFLEMAVVIAVICILVALMLPAVQAAREAARRSQCTNNLHQLSTAVSHYEHAHQVYPPGVISGTRPIRNSPKGYHHSWLVQILPFSEEKSTWRAIDMKLSVYHPKNAVIGGGGGMANHFCPSSPNPGISYAGVHHDLEAPIDVDNRGIFFLNSKVARIDVFDGLSHTLFIGEKISDGADLGWMSGTRSTLRNTGARLNAALPSRARAGAAGQAVEVDTELKDTEPEEEIIDEYGFGDTLPKSRDRSDDDELLGIPGLGSEAIGGGGGTGTGGFEVGGFSSYHTGVAQFALGDGSVQTISEMIDQTVLQRMANRANGDLREGDR